LQGKWVQLTHKNRGLI